MSNVCLILIYHVVSSRPGQLVICGTFPIFGFDIGGASIQVLLRDTAVMLVVDSHVNTAVMNGIVGKEKTEWLMF